MVATGSTNSNLSIKSNAMMPVNKPPADAPQSAVSNPVLAGLKITQPLLVRLHEQHRKSLRRQRDGQRAVLRNCDLSRLDLRGMVFDDAEFVACDFRRKSEFF